MSRLKRSKAKRARKDRLRRHQPRRSTDGPTCPHCEPHVNGILGRRTLLDRIHSREMEDA